MTVTSRPTEESVALRIKAIVVEQLGVDEDEVTPEASIIEDLGADSLDTIELAMAVEEEFGLEIPDQDIEKIEKVSDATAYVWARVQPKQV